MCSYDQVDVDLLNYALPHIQRYYIAKSISKGFDKLTWHLLLFANSHNKIQRIKISHLQGNWHLELANDKNRRSPGARAFLARDFTHANGFAKSSTA